MDNHNGCQCSFIRKVKVGLADGRVYSGQVWKTPGGTEYLRVFHTDDPKIYLKISMEDGTIIEESPSPHDGN